jgi:hypothetical protein
MMTHGGVVSFTLRPLYSWGKSPWYPLGRKLGGPQNRSGLRGEEEVLEPSGTRTSTSRSSSPQPVAIPNTLSRLKIEENPLYEITEQFTVLGNGKHSFTRIDRILHRYLVK